LVTPQIDQKNQHPLTYALYYNNESKQILQPFPPKRSTKTDRERCILNLLGLVGLRAAELVAVKVEDVDFAKCYLHVLGKRNKRRVVVLLPSVVDALQTYLAGRTKGWLLPSRAGDHITTRQLQTILHNVAVRAGLQEVSYTDASGKKRRQIHPHILRHSFAVWSLDAGVPIGALQEQLGHSSLATTGIYLKASPNHRRESYLRSKLGQLGGADRSL
jgi:integrase/recombinase XerC